MIKPIAILLSGVLAQGVPFADQDAGIVQVASAIPCVSVEVTDGGWTCAPNLEAQALGPAWWVSQSRVKKIGDNVAQCTADKQSCVDQLNKSETSVKSYLIIFSVGFISGAVLTMYGISQFKKVTQ